jgi:hypothetical protein
MAVFEYSIFQYLIVSLITILNPWNMIGDDSKSRIINKTINTSVQILRSQEIETIYDTIDINPLKDTVTIKDINFTYYIKDENEICTFEQLVNDNYNKFKDYYGCPIYVSVESIELIGLFSENYNVIQSNLKLNNVSLNLDLLENNEETRAIKDLVLGETISFNINYNAKYYLNKNTLSFNLLFSINNLIEMNFNTLLSRISLPLNFENNDNFKFTFNEFKFKITDKGFIDSANSILEAYNQQNLFDSFTSNSNLLFNDAENTEQRILIRNYINNFSRFLQSPGSTFVCNNRNNVTFEMLDFNYGYRNIENAILNLCDEHNLFY